MAWRDLLHRLGGYVLAVAAGGLAGAALHAKGSWVRGVEAVPLEVRPHLWQEVAVGAIAGLAFQATAALRKHGRFGLYASWMISMTIGCGIFAMPVFGREPLLEVLGVWLILGSFSGIGMAMFVEWVRH